MTRQEEDFPPGHPARCDFNPKSPEALAWAREHYAPLGERDFPRGHLKAVDTPGNENHVAVLAGINPAHPELEPFSGRTPEQVEALRELQIKLSTAAEDTPPREPVLAPEAPEPIERPIPTGQPSDVSEDESSTHGRGSPRHSRR